MLTLPFFQGGGMILIVCFCLRWHSRRRYRVQIKTKFPRCTINENQWNISIIQCYDVCKAIINHLNPHILMILMVYIPPFVVNLRTVYRGFTNISPHVPAVSLENKRNFHPRWQAANMPLVVNIRYEKRLQPQFSATGLPKWNRLPHHFIVQFSRIQQDSAMVFEKWLTKTYALWLQDCAHCAAEGRAEGQDILGPRRKLWLKWKATCFNSKSSKFGYRLHNLSGVCCIIPPL